MADDQTRSYCVPWTPVDCFLPNSLLHICAICAKSFKGHQVARALTIAVCWDCGGYAKMRVSDDEWRVLTNTAPQANPPGLYLFGVPPAGGCSCGQHIGDNEDCPVHKYP